MNTSLRSVTFTHSQKHRGRELARATRGRLFVTISLLALTAAANLLAVPILGDPSPYRVELFADLSSIDPNLDAFQLTLSSGESGFPAGLYVTPGPAPAPGGRHLIRYDSHGQATVITTALSSAETMLFARGSYGDGILVTEPRNQRIMRLTADGSLTSFASVTPGPFGPPVITYGPGGTIFATGGSIGTDEQASPFIYQIAPDGSSSVFATLDPAIFAPTRAFRGVVRTKALSYASRNLGGTWQTGGGFVVGTFSSPASGGLSASESLYTVGLDGTTGLLVSGLSGLELTELGPDGNLYVATEGDRLVNGDGVLYSMNGDGTLFPFLSGIDAIDVAFDSSGMFGGDIFISDGTNRAGAGKIWRVTAVPEPGTLTMVLAGAIVGTLVLVRRRFKHADAPRR